MADILMAEPSLISWVKSREQKHFHRRTWHHLLEPRGEILVKAGVLYASGGGGILQDTGKLFVSNVYISSIDSSKPVCILVA